MNTPIIALSSSSTKMQNARVCLCTDSHEPSRASGVRNPVSTSSSRLMPSTPTKYSMPNAGIHACRSTNWKSPDDTLKRLHSSTVSANTSSETTSAILRASGALCSSSPRTSSSRMAPATGNATRDERIGKGITVEPAQRIQRSSAPQVVPQDRDDAEEQGRGVGADRPGLQPPQQVARAADGLADAVDRAVNHLDVDHLPQPGLGHDADRLDDGGVVDFVDVVLVEQQPLQAAEAVGHRIRCAAVFEKEEHGDADAGDRRRTRHQHQRAFEAVLRRGLDRRDAEARL